MGTSQALLSAMLIVGSVTVAQDEFLLDFDTMGPTTDAELPDFFELYGFDNFFGPAPGWRIDANAQNPANGSNALHTTSDVRRLADYFSRVSIL